jgi:hypothetical protein
VTESDGTVELARFVREIDVLQKRPDRAGPCCTGTGVLSSFDGVLGIGVEAGDWPEAALSHLTLAPLVAQSLTGAETGGGSFSQSPDRSADEPVSVTNQSTQRTATGEIDRPADGDNATEEPRVREVVREAGSPSRTDTSSDRRRPGSRDVIGSDGLERDGSDDILGERNPPRMDVHQSAESASDADSDAWPPTRTSHDSWPSGHSGDAGDPATADSAGSSDAENKRSSDRRVRVSARPNRTPGTIGRSPSMTVRSADPDATADPATTVAPPRSQTASPDAGGSATQRGGSADVVATSETVVATQRESGAGPTTQGGFEAAPGPFAEPVPLEPLDVGVGPDEMGARPEYTGDQSGRRPSGRTGPRMTVREDAGPTTDDAEAAVEAATSTASSEQDGERSPWGPNQRDSLTEVDEQTLTDAIDVEQLTDQLTDRLYRAIEEKRRIERERRGL